MALSRTDYTPHLVLFPGNSTTTPSYTFPNGELVFVAISIVNEVGAENPAALISIDDTGANLDWQLVVRKDDGTAADYMCGLAVFRAIGNGTACTITVSKTGSQLGRCLVQPYSFTGANNASPVGGTMALSPGITDGSSSGSLSASPASTSEVMAFLCGTCNGFNLTAITPGTGWSEDYDTHSPDYMIAQGQFRTGSTSATVSWNDVLASGDGYYHAPVMVAFEVVAAASGSSYSLTCGQGSYTLNGQTIALKIARKVAANQGSYALNGQVSSLLRKRFLSALQGAYSLTGMTSSLFRSLKLVAVQGAYVLSGQAALFKRTFRLQSVQGSYSLNGQAASLQSSLSATLSAELGSYSLNGQTLFLKSARNISGIQGSYSLTGFAARKLIAFKASFASYSLTGFPSNLSVSKKISANTGSYSVNGFSAGLKASYKLNCAFGTYSNQGQTVNLLYSAAGYFLSAGFGQYSLNGNSVSFAHIVRLPVDYYFRTQWNFEMNLDAIVLEYFGEETLYFTDAGMTKPKGVFNQYYQLVDNGMAGTMSFHCSVFYLLKDLPEDPKVKPPASLNIRGVSYKCIESKKDMIGGITLVLHKA